MTSLNGVGFTAAAQSNKVTGIVKDAKGEPLIGATIMVKGTKHGTATDLDGKFQVNAAPGSTLIVSYVGSKPQEVKVTGSSMEITMDDGSQTLD